MMVNRKQSEEIISNWIIRYTGQFSPPLFSHQLVSNFLQPHGLHPHLSLFPRVCSNSLPIELVMLSNFPSGIGASASVLPMNMQGRFPLGLTDLISLLSKRLSRVFSNIKLQKHQFCSALILFYDPTLTSVRDYWKNHNFDYMDLCQQSDISLLSMLARFIIAFLLRSKHLLIL